MLVKDKIRCKIIFKNGKFNKLRSIKGEINQDNFNSLNNEWIFIEDIEINKSNNKINKALIHKQDIEKIINLNTKKRILY